MPTKVVDISMIGDRRLEKKFARLAPAVQKKIARQALRASAKRIKPHAVRKSTTVIDVQTGQTAQAVKKSKIRSGGRRRLIRVGLAMPTREALGISPDDKHYYLSALEYGSKRGIRERRIYRDAVDERRRREQRVIGRDIGRGITREARR